MRWLFLLAGLVTLTALAGFAILHLHKTSKAQTSSVELTVYLCAAAKKPWQELVTEFERETGIKVNAIYGSSGKLYSTIEMTHRGDVFAPASPQYMAKALVEGLVYPDTVRQVAYLLPEIIVPKGNPAGIEKLEDLLRPGVRLAIGDPEHVVIGHYAVELFKHNGMWPEVQENIVTYAENFAKLATLVATGAVDAIIGWHVTYYWYPDRTEIIWLKPGQIPEASYIPIAVLKTSKNPEAAKKFIEFVTESEYARQMWGRYHYLTSPEEVQEKAPGTKIPSIQEIAEKLVGKSASTSKS